MKVGDMVRHGWVRGKYGLITKVVDKPRTCTPGEMMRRYDILWFDKNRKVSYVSEEASISFEVISESR